MKRYELHHEKTYTPGPLYNIVHYNMILDITLITVGPQMVILDLSIHFTVINNTDWIANTEIGLDTNNSNIMRLRCIWGF